MLHPNFNLLTASIWHRLGGSLLLGRNRTEPLEVFGGQMDPQLLEAGDSNLIFSECLLKGPPLVRFFPDRLKNDTLAIDE